jgi:hypothetical protein
MIAFPAVIIAALAAIILTGGFNVNNDCERIELYNNRRRAEGELCYSLESIKTTLLKVRYSNCPQLTGELLEGLYDYAVKASDCETLKHTDAEPPELHVPLMLIGAREVSAEEAHEAAVRASGAQGLTLIAEEAGRTPSYVFSSGDVTAAVTKAGGFLSYMLSYREVEAERITASQAANEARRYLERLGITNIIETFHEIRDNICIIEFAGIQDNITLYTDIIKIAVAMDNGGVLSADKRGWLSNHEPNGRGIDEAALSIEEARARVSPLLTVEGAKLCIIRSGSGREVLCYEFRCYAEDGRQLLVYINADTGREERILLLEISGYGFIAV